MSEMIKTNSSSAVAVASSGAGQLQLNDGWQMTARGKGRIKPRRDQIEHGVSFAPRLANISHIDAEHGEREGDPKPRYKDNMVDGWVEYLTFDAPQQVYKAMNAIRNSQPVLLRGAPVAQTIAGKFIFGSLSALRVVEELPVMCSQARHHRYFQCNLPKNIREISGYYIRELETQILKMTPKDFVESAASWQKQKLMLKTTVLEYTKKPQSGVEAAKTLPGLDVASNELAIKIKKELEEKIDWPWLQSFLVAQRYGAVLKVDLEAGVVGGLQPAQYQIHDSLLIQVSGRRRVLLIPPESAFDAAYPYAVAHPYDCYCMVDLEAPDTGRWPHAVGKEWHGLSCILQPGDVCYVPQFWFAHIQELEKENVCLRFVLHGGTRSPGPRSLALRLSRTLEERCADVVGVADVNRWLRLTARGAELDALDLSTASGYQRVVMCQGLRDEIDATLGVGKWRELLKDMCGGGRLQPTPWLNQEFRNPLLLTDKPVRYEDTRTEAEKKYPQLFRKKLEAEGWKVAPSVSTVPIPGYHVPMNYRA